MRCQEVIAVLEELSPLSYAEEWDHVGLLVGRTDREVGRVMLALDASDAVIAQAVTEEANLLVTHHPLLFRPLQRVTTDEVNGRRVFRLIRHDICCYAMHTNFDVMGMADAVADELELGRRQVLAVTSEDEIAREGFGRFGRLPRPMTLPECAAFVRRRFSLPPVPVFARTWTPPGREKDRLEWAAVCPGSGKGFVEEAIRLGADVYITGDIDHHTGMDAAARGLSVIDAGHYGLEHLFVAYMREYLERKCPELTVLEAQEEAPFRLG